MRSTNEFYERLHKGRSEFVTFIRCVTLIIGATFGMRLGVQSLSSKLRKICWATLQAPGIAPIETKKIDRKFRVHNACSGMVRSTHLEGTVKGPPSSEGGNSIKIGGALIGEFVVDVRRPGYVAVVHTQHIPIQHWLRQHTQPEITPIGYKDVSAQRAQHPPVLA